MKKLIVLILLTGSLCSFESYIRSGVPPQGTTGAAGVYCNGCHSGNQLNAAGGSVSITGLPAQGYTAGVTYNFSVTINHNVADRRRWGFSVIAKNSTGQTVGTFNSTNPNADNNGEELSHLNAVTFPSVAQSYTYNNLSWTAPANPTANDQAITFYVAGNAANGTGNTSGDFIYSGTLVITQAPTIVTYTFTGNGNWEDPVNWSNNQVPPSTVSNNTNIIINPVDDGECVLNTEQHIDNGATFTVIEGKKFRVTGNLIINN